MEKGSNGTTNESAFDSSAPIDEPSLDVALPPEPKPEPKAKAKPKAKLSSEEKAQKAIDAAMAASAELETMDPESIRIHTMIPGLLVQLYVATRGGRWTEHEVISYTEDEEGRRVEEKKLTHQVTEDKIEHDKCSALGAKLRRAIEAHGAKTRIGLIVPVKNEKQLRKTIVSCKALADQFNSTSETCDVVFSCALFETSGNMKELIASVNSQLATVMDTVRQARLLDDADVLKLVTKKSPLFKPYKNAREVLEKAKPEERVMILARVRADITRKAMADAKQFCTVLPEEASLSLSKVISKVRESCTAWVASAKESKEAFNKAINGFDDAVISNMQTVLVQQAAMADADADATNAALAEDEPIAPVAVAPEGQLTFGDLDDAEAL